MTPPNNLSKEGSWKIDLLLLHAFTDLWIADIPREVEVDLRSKSLPRGGPKWSLGSCAWRLYFLMRDTLGVRLSDMQRDTFGFTTSIGW